MKLERALDRARSKPAQLKWVAQVEVNDGDSILEAIKVTRS